MTDFESFFSDYATRYMESDVDGVAAMYDAPLLAVREGRILHLEDESALRQHLAGLMDAYARAGAARADIAALHADHLGAHAANVTVGWHVVDAGGALVRDFRTTYFMCLMDGAWRIRTYTNHDE